MKFLACVANIVSMPAGFTRVTDTGAPFLCSSIRNDSVKPFTACLLAT